MVFQLRNQIINLSTKHPIECGTAVEVCVLPLQTLDVLVVGLCAALFFKFLLSLLKSSQLVLQLPLPPFVKSERCMHSLIYGG